MAAQHAQYSQLQKSGGNPEHICAEKIAEQQLRIKQVCILVVCLYIIYMCVCICVCMHVFVLFECVLYLNVAM